MSQREEDLVDSEKGLSAGLFDLSFTTFITTKIAKALYVIGIVIQFMGLCGFVAYMIFSGNVLSTTEKALFVLSPLLFFAYLICWRVFMELIVVVFRIAEHLRDISKATAGQMKTCPECHQWVMTSVKACGQCGFKFF